MTKLLVIELVCPVCGTHFSSRAVRSVTTVGQDTDFCPRVVGENPVAHYVHVCPRCHFAAFEGDFDQVQPQVREFVLSAAFDDVLEAEAPGALLGSTKYLLAARCYEHDARATRVHLADLYLRASWCARAEGDIERERACQLEAILRFEEAIAEGEVPPERQQTILYLIGELYRRVGRYELAETMLKRAADYQAEHRDPDIAALARQQYRAAMLHRCNNMVIDL